MSDFKDVMNMSDHDFLAKLNLSSGTADQSNGASYAQSNYFKPRIDNFGTGNAAVN